MAKLNGREGWIRTNIFACKLKVVDSFLSRGSKLLTLKDSYLILLRFPITPLPDDVSHTKGVV